MRIPVATVAGMAAERMQEKEILESYPDPSGDWPGDRLRPGEQRQTRVSLNDPERNSY
jgi:hypothetical protein